MAELSALQLRALRAAAAPDATSFVLVDLRDSVQVTEVFERVWAPNYIVQKEIRSGLPTLAADLSSNPCAVVVLTCHAASALSEGLPSEVMQDLTALWAVQEKPLVVRLTDDGKMFADGRIISCDPYDLPLYAEGATITVQGVGGPCIRHHAELPFQLGISIAHPSPSSWIEVSGHGDGHLLPHSRRFHLSGLASGRVEINIDPGRRADRWQITCTDQLNQPHPIRVLEGRRQASSHPPDRLAVIFDRTCPDVGQWARARAISLGEVSQAPPAFLEDTSAMDDKPCPQSEVNAEIRRALGPALAESIAAADVIIDGWWFADTPGDGIIEPPGAQTPATNFATQGCEPAKRGARLFDEMTWYPGLDLWDPLDEALDAAVTNLVRARGQRKAVLVVGNSPPYLPLGTDNPFHEIRSALGHHTAVRRSSDLWKDTLERCRHHHINIAYLFLSHDQTPPGLGRAFDLFRQVQRDVQNAIELSGIHVESQPANAVGVAAGVRTAWQVLSSPMDTSNVRVIP